MAENASNSRHAFSVHIPVLLREAIELLAPAPGDTAIDCTVGLGGHAAAIAERIGPTGTLILFDLDPLNLEVSTRRIQALPNGPRVVAHHGSFAEVGRLLGKDGCPPASVVLADLGFASPQVDDPMRGFSFMRDGPLDMRLNPQAPISAGELVGTMPEQELADLIREYGEEPPDIARRIASKVVLERKQGPINTTARLAAIVRSAIPPARAAASSIHPATRTFQALRIAVNDEIGSLNRLLDSIGRAAQMAVGGKESWLARGARIGIISFHSLEDRPVKQKFAEMAERGTAELLTKKPLTASDEETAANPRSRSAKLRGVRILGRSERDG